MQISFPLQPLIKINTLCIFSSWIIYLFASKSLFMAEHLADLKTGFEGTSNSERLSDGVIGLACTAGGSSIVYLGLEIQLSNLYSGPNIFLLPGVLLGSFASVYGYKKLQESVRDTRLERLLPHNIPQEVVILVYRGLNKVSQALKR